MLFVHTWKPWRIEMDGSLVTHSDNAMLLFSNKVQSDHAIAFVRGIYIRTEICVDKM